MNVEQLIEQLNTLDPKGVPFYIDREGYKHEILSIKDFDGEMVIDLEYIEED